MRTFRRGLLTGALLLAAVQACDPTEPYRVLDEERVVVSVRMNPDSLSAQPGDTLKLAATAIGRGDRSVSEATFEWSSGDLSIVRSLGEGRFVVVSRGNAQLFATTRGIRGVARLLVP